MNLTLPGHPARPLRLFEIVGDGMEPVLRGGDFLMVAPAEGHLYDATYLLDWGDGEAPYVATRHGDRVVLHHPNPKYADHTVEAADFNEAVTAIVVAEVKVTDRRMIEAARVQRVQRTLAARRAA